jgi:hypothetical protein
MWNAVSLPPGMIRDEDIRDKPKELDEHIRKEYIESHPKKERG